MQLTREFYSRPTLEVAEDLLGKALVRVESNGDLTSGLIVETEAYVGVDDLGCHARSGKTPRNVSMWGPPGHAYVYFNYGMHWLFNIVTERDDFPAAVLIRAIVPIKGLEIIRERRSRRGDTELTNGPAKLTQALGIKRETDGVDLCQIGSTLYLEEGKIIDPATITTHSRVGLNSVPEPWKSIKWNFRVSLQFAKPYPVASEPLP